MIGFEERVLELAADVPAVDDDAAREARSGLAVLVKPILSLGRVEDVGIRLAAVAGACPPPVPEHPAVVVAAGDHGVHARGVTRWPQEVTAAMVGVIAEGRASVNAFARTVGASVTVLDVGVAGAVANHPAIRSSRVRAGTDDLSRGPAMTRDEAARAVLAGAGLVEELVAGGADLLITGDMGIANTTAASCLIAAFTGATPEEVTGRGAANDDQTLQRKQAVIAEALAQHNPDAHDPLGVLAALGGLEHAALVGVILSAAADRIPVVLDGVNACAAALVAAALAPHSADAMVAGHRSTEPAASIALRALRLEPLLDLSLHLGEGTGGLLAVPIVIAAARLLSEVATIDEVVAAGDTPATPGDAGAPGVG